MCLNESQAWNTGKSFPVIQLWLWTFPSQKGNAQVWVLCLWFFKATWLWRSIHFLVLLLFQSDDHGAVAENIDSTWEAQLRLGQVSNRYTDRNLDISKSKKLSYSRAKARLHWVKFKPAVLNTAKENGWTGERCDWKTDYISCPFGNYLEKNKLPNLLCQGVPRCHLEIRDWSWDNGGKYF